jgi:hypothetical protein
MKAVRGENFGEPGCQGTANKLFVAIVRELYIPSS